MSIDGLSDDTVRQVLSETRRIALVGASANPARPSNGVMRFLLQRGFEVTPVNPGLAGQAIHGRTVVASLEDAGPLDMVDVFRARQHVGPLMDEAIRLGAKTVWLQLGVINPPAAEAGRAAGLTVVVDRCPAIEWPRLGMPSRIPG
ncbi:MAG: CoA-binding protein [Acidisphaera sp.]|nr:CoA-binding protein [Acidisphaera sp.]